MHDVTFKRRSTTAAPLRRCDTIRLSMLGPTLPAQKTSLQEENEGKQKSSRPASEQEHPPEKKRRVAEPSGSGTQNDTDDNTAGDQQGSSATEPADDAAAVKAEGRRSDQEATEHSERQRRFMQAQWWYYRDAQQTVQGPFYPGQMRRASRSFTATPPLTECSFHHREWVLGGWIPENQPCAPSYQGEVPQEMSPINELFDSPVVDNCFLVAPGIANFPPADLQEEPAKKEMSREELVKSLMANRDKSLPSQNGLGMN